MEELEFSLSLNVNETLRDMAAKGVEAEAGGLDLVWVGDHPDQKYPAIVAGLIAEATKKIRIGLGPLTPFLHPIEHISSMITTLSEAYGQRFDLCLVPGDRLKLRSVGVNYGKNISNKMLEHLGILRERFSKRGINVRIWLGAQGPKMLEISKKFDGVLINLSHPTMIESTITRSSLSRYMRDNKNFKIGIFFPSYLYRSYNSEIHRKVERAALQVMLGTSRTILRDHNLERVVEVTRGTGSYKEIPLEILRRFYVSMPAQNLRDYISSVRGIGVSHFAFAFPQNSKIELIKDLAYAVKLVRKSL